MNWHDGLILVWQLHGYGFKSWETQIKLYFILLMLTLEGIGRGKRNLLESTAKGGCNHHS